MLISYGSNSAFTLSKIAPSVSVHSHLTILWEMTGDPPRLVDTLSEAFNDANAHAQLYIYVIFIFFSNLQIRGSVGPVKQQ